MGEQLTNIYVNYALFNCQYVYVCVDMLTRYHVLQLVTNYFITCKYIIE